ncbi:MAG: amino acid ABC transporter permease, partial [Chloroflexi bacterium]|nr:amino acid ABC transporter permease [Chloroflexota bacterium]
SWAVWGGVMRTFARIMAAAGLIVALTPIEPAGFDAAVRLWYLGGAAAVALGFAVGRAASPDPKWVIWAWALAFFLGMALIWGFDERSIGSSLRMFFGAGATLTAVLGAVGWVGRFPAGAVLRWLAWGWALVFVVTIVMAWGLGQTDLAPRVNTNQWGGLLLTFVLALVGIVASFPIGVLLALGRRSQLPVLKGLSIAFIELVRGVPLVTLLFMTVVIVPLFLPRGTSFDLVLRAVFAITLFSSAYMAENVRGGLAAVPLGQIEGAKALGLGGLQTMLFVVLPQALRAVIPAIVGQFISLYKDTSLVVIVGLLDILGIGKSLFLGNVRWFGAQAEVYLFVAAVFWVFTFAMAYASRKVEESLGVGSR